MSGFNNNNLTSLKLSFNGEIRRLPVASHDLTYQDLMTKTLSVFPLLTSLQFSWVDDENDNVVFSSNEELTEALRVMATDSKKGYLRFKVLATAATDATQKTTNCKETFFGTISATHVGITCNECGVSPLPGARYMCSVRAKYDLCETCEGLVCQEPFPTLKIYYPDQQSAAFTAIAEERRGISGGPKYHCRGGRCSGCHTPRFTGPRYKCTVRNDYELCEACERKDSHAHVMVKVYPRHDRRDVSSSHQCGDVLPAATCHFRHSMTEGRLAQGRPDDRHGQGKAREGSHRGGRGWRKDKKDKGRHCWDRASVALAAANRAKQKADEESLLDDALLEMCIKESLAEQESMARSSTTSTTPSSCAQKGRKGTGRHCWDRTSVTQAAASRAEKSPPRVYRCPDDTAMAQAAAKRAVQRASVMSFLRKGEGMHNWDRPSVMQAAATRALHASVMVQHQAVHKAKEDAILEDELFGMCIKQSLEEKKGMLATVIAAKTAKTSILQPATVTKASSAFKQGVQWVIQPAKTDTSTPNPNVDHNTRDRDFKESVKWVIQTDETKDCMPDKKNISDLYSKLFTLRGEAQTLMAATTTPVDELSAPLLPPPHPSLLPSNEGDQEGEQHQRAAEVLTWSQELQVLCDMGFSDLEQLLPMLRVHIKTPSSQLQQEQVQVQEQGGGPPPSEVSEQGMQALVLALLSGDN